MEPDNDEQREASDDTAQRAQPTAGSPVRSEPGQNARGGSSATSEAGREGATSDAGPAGSADGKGSGALEGELLERVAELDENERDGLLTALRLSRSWAGLLPDPDSFARYKPDVQERMMCWNDSFTIDESRRQDKLVDAQVELAKKTSWRSTVIVLVCLVLAALAVFWKNNVWAAGVFLGTPILLYAASVVQEVRSKSSQPPSRAGKAIDTSADESSEA